MTLEKRADADTIQTILTAAGIPSDRKFALDVPYEDAELLRLVHASVQVLQPKVGEKIYDGAVGSAGFLCDAVDYLKQGNLITPFDAARKAT